MAKFSWIEAYNMQAQRHDLEIRSLTPRIGATTTEGTFGNLCDAKVTVKAGMSGNVFVSETAGKFTSWNPESLQTDGSYRIAYRVSLDAFAMEASPDVPYRLAFPLWPTVADDRCCDATTEMRLTRQRRCVLRTPLTKATR